MTTEQFETAYRKIKEIEAVKEQIHYWQNYELQTIVMKAPGKYDAYPNMKYVDAALLKFSALTKLQAELSDMTEDLDKI